MSRDRGFAVADTSTSLMDDPKVRAMWRALRPDEAAMATAMHLHEAVRLASWREGERVSAEDSAPAWMTDITTPASHLKEHGLLDADGKVPRTTWRHWFGAADSRRKETRERWRRSKQKARQPGDPSTNVSDGSTPSPRGHHSGSTGPSVPTVPTVRPSPRARRARGRGGLTPINGGSNGDMPRSDTEAIARAQAKLDDPTTSEDVKTAARFALKQLGVSA